MGERPRAARGGAVSHSRPLNFENDCLSFKWGEFNALVCCYEKGHSGDHCYIVAPKYVLDELERRKAAAPK